MAPAGGYRRRSEAVRAAAALRMARKYYAQGESGFFVHQHGDDDQLSWRSRSGRGGVARSSTARDTCSERGEDVAEDEAVALNNLADFDVDR